MKLVKLSLAAAVAAGALAMSASAVPLEEAIKDVDLNGYARMRYTHNNESDKNVHREKSSVWEFKSEVDFKAKIDDNFFGVVGVRFMDRLFHLQTVYIFRRKMKRMMSLNLILPRPT